MPLDNKLSKFDSDLMIYNKSEFFSQKKYFDFYNYNYIKSKYFYSYIISKVLYKFMIDKKFIVSITDFTLFSYFFNSILKQKNIHICNNTILDPSLYYKIYFDYRPYIESKLIWIQSLYFSALYFLTRDIVYAGVRKYYNNLLSKTKIMFIKNKLVFINKFHIKKTITNFQLYIDTSLYQKIIDSNLTSEQKDIVLAHTWLYNKYYTFVKKYNIYVQTPYNYFYNKKTRLYNSSKLDLNPLNFFYPLKSALLNFFFFKGDFYAISLLLRQYRFFHKRNIEYYILYMLAITIRYNSTYKNIMYFVNKMRINIFLYNLNLFDLFTWSKNNLNFSSRHNNIMLLSYLMKPISSFTNFCMILRNEQIRKFSLKRKFSYLFRVSKQIRSLPLRRHKKKILSNRYIYKRVVRLLKWQKMNNFSNYIEYKPIVLKEVHQFIRSYNIIINFLKKSSYTSFNINYPKNSGYKFIRFFKTRKFNMKLAVPFFKQGVSKLFLKLAKNSFRFLKPSHYKKFSKNERRLFHLQPYANKPKVLIRKNNNLTRSLPRKMKLFIKMFLYSYKNKLLLYDYNKYIFNIMNIYNNKGIILFKRWIIHWKITNKLFTVGYIANKITFLKKKKFNLKKLAFCFLKQPNLLKRKFLFLLYLKYKKFPLSKIINFLTGCKSKKKKKKKTVMHLKKQ